MVWAVVVAVVVGVMVGVMVVGAGGDGGKPLRGVQRRNWQPSWALGGRFHRDGCGPVDTQIAAISATCGVCSKAAKYDGAFVECDALQQQHPTVPVLVWEGASW